MAPSPSAPSSPGAAAPTPGGPLRRRPAPPRLAARGPRLGAAAIALASAVVLTVATILSPASEGLGTHRALGLPQCGWIVSMDLPCPTCGMTTAFSHAANGSFLASATTQPLGFLLALITAMALVGGVIVAVTGAPLYRPIGRQLTARMTGFFEGLVIFSWGYKILSHRGLL